MQDIGEMTVEHWLLKYRKLEADNKHLREELEECKTCCDHIGCENIVIKEQDKRLRKLLKDNNVCVLAIAYLQQMEFAAAPGEWERRLDVEALIEKIREISAALEEAK
jgi:hypothetical protein